MLPAPLAHNVGVTQFGEEVTLQLDGHTAEVPLYAQLQRKTDRPTGGEPDRDHPALLCTATDRPVQSSESHPRAARPRIGRPGASALEALAAGRLNVESTDYDEKLFAKAAAASNQSTALFSVISALVGFLFAFNAMLLTVPQRRR